MNYYSAQSVHSGRPESSNRRV